jgi:hypothetical protein
LKQEKEESIIKAFEDAASKNGELDVFAHESVKNMIKFKWESYAYKNHYLGFLMHIQYILCMALYIYNTFLIGVYARVANEVWTWLLVLGITYPFIYDTIQFYKQGWGYFLDSWNYTDMAFQYSGLVNIIFKFIYPD